MLVIGCDPGLTGALALVHPDRGLLDVIDLPTAENGLASGSMKRWIDEAALNELLREWSARHGFAAEAVEAALERPIPMPTLPAQTIASQFDTFGVLRAVLSRFAQQVHFPEPRAWKKRFGVGNDKEAARACVLRLYPEAPVTRVKDHNRAESILMARWLIKELA